MPINNRVGRLIVVYSYNIHYNRKEQTTDSRNNVDELHGHVE